MHLKLILGIIAVILFSGCSSTKLDPSIDFKPPKYVQQMPSQEQEDLSNLGSLFGSGDRPLFSDRKAMRVNDIVTVLISEQATASSTGSKTIDRTNEITYNPAALSYNGTTQGVQKAVSALNNGLSIGLGINNESAFSGSGTTNRSEQFTTTISARIVKVMVNGNYFIEGGREILVNGEKQIVQLSGVIRPYDIDTSNRINSTLIADARILYRTEGDIERSTNKGWGTKILDVVWPF